MLENLQTISEVQINTKEEEEEKEKKKANLLPL